MRLFGPILYVKLYTYFTDYINIPQKFACDNLNVTIQNVKNQLEQSNPDTFIYLYGCGHVKSGLIYHLLQFKNAIYIDIGGGIDGIAGILDPERPYAYQWTNYRLLNYDYSNIDLLRYDITNDKNIKYINNI